MVLNAKLKSTKRHTPPTKGTVSLLMTTSTSRNARSFWRTLIRSTTTKPPSRFPTKLRTVKLFRNRRRRFGWKTWTRLSLKRGIRCPVVSTWKRCWAILLTNRTNNSFVTRLRAELKTSTFKWISKQLFPTKSYLIFFVSADFASFLNEWGHIKTPKMSV